MFDHFDKAISMMSNLPLERTKGTLVIRIVRGLKLFDALEVHAVGAIPTLAYTHA